MDVSSFILDMNILKGRVRTIQFLQIIFLITAFLFPSSSKAFILFLLVFVRFRRSCGHSQLLNCLFPASGWTGISYHPALFWINCVIWEGYGMLWSIAFCCFWALSLDPSGNCRNKSLELSDRNSILKHVAHDSQSNVVINRDLGSGLLLRLNKDCKPRLSYSARFLLLESYFSRNLTVKCLRLCCQCLTFI